MKVSKKEAGKIAKELLSLSILDNRIDELKMLKIVKKVKEVYKYKRSSLNILKALLTLVKQYLARQTLVIESADRLHPRYVEEIKSHFEKVYEGRFTVKVRVQPSTLGGVKVSIGDKMWDYSTSRKINQLKESLSG